MKDGFTLTLAGNLSEVARLTGRLDEFAREHSLPARAVQHMTLALDELVTNIVEHGGPHDDGSWHSVQTAVRARLWLEPGWLHAELIDAGQPFDPFAQAARPDLAADLENRPIGGLGVHFVRTLIERFGYERRGDHNVVSLAKSLGGDRRRRESHA